LAVVAAAEKILVVVVVLVDIKLAQDLELHRRKRGQS